MRQVPGTAHYGGCYVCGEVGHRAADCAAAMESWMVKQMVQRGVDWAKVNIAQIMAKAEVRAKQQRRSWSQVVQQGGEGRAQRWRPSEEARKRYAERRQVRRAQQAAQTARQKAAAAMEAVRRGEYPTPWASLTEAQAKVKEATAQRRASVQLQQQARKVQLQQQQGQLVRSAPQEQQSRQAAGWALHKELEAKTQQRNAEASLQRAQQQAKEAKLELKQQQQAQPWAVLRRQEAAAAAAAKRMQPSGLSSLQPDVNMIDMSLSAPCLHIPCFGTIA